MKTILFVCTGNICRSPMAEGLMRHVLRGNKEFEVISAGLNAMDGQPPSEYSLKALRELNIDISSIRSRHLTPDLVRRADVIFVMTHGHERAILSLYPSA